MKLTLEQKLRLGHALWVSELMEATGYSRAAIKRIRPPLVAGKIRLADFWAHVRARWQPVIEMQQADEPLTMADLLRSHEALTVAHASPVPSNGPPSGEGIPDERPPSYVRTSALRLLAGCPTHNT